MRYLKWKYNDQPIVQPPLNTFGFVYKVTQISTGKIYIGKKNFWVNSVDQSNWLQYTTSSKLLSSLIKDNPNDFKGEIVKYGMTSKQLGYFEKQLQEAYGVFRGDDFNKIYNHKNVIK